MPSTVKQILLTALLILGCGFSSVAAAQLALSPASPTPLDVVRLRWFHVGCTNPDSVQVTMRTDQVTVSADRLFAIDCGTIRDYFDEYTVGRLPTGDYDIQLVVNPPPPTLGPSQLIGSVHLTVGALPATAATLPHEDYSDVWLDPSGSAMVLTVKQIGDKLGCVWSVFDTDGRATWYLLLPGSWVRDAANNLRYDGIVYRETGPYWGNTSGLQAASAEVVGTGSFVPEHSGKARFDYMIGGVSGSKQLVRMTTF